MNRYTDIDTMLERDTQREAERMRREREYDPVTGAGSLIMRVEATAPACARIAGKMFLPPAMLDDPEWKRVGCRREFDRLRFRYDFEYWAVTCVKIRDKETGRRIPFRLNAPQRRFTAMLEADRMAGRPLRFIMLKARQWGGSTLVQMYFAYIQIIHKPCWHSIVCAHVRDTSSTLRGLYGGMLADYPRQLWPADCEPKLKTVSGSRSKVEIAGTGSTIDIGTSMSPDALRGNDFALAHLSEVAFWAESGRRNPTDFIRTVSGSVPLVPYSAIILESSANGIGSFFYNMWRDAEKGMGAYKPMFVPWHEIDRYRLLLSDEERREVASTLTPYEEAMEEQGLTLGQIAWRRLKRAEYPTDSAMEAEFPASPTEAFVNTCAGVFDKAAVEAMRADCRAPELTGRIVGAALTGPRALEGVHTVADSNGPLRIWKRPDMTGASTRYVVTVDIGGRAASSDWSVIAVVDRCGDHGAAEVVAQWRGHADHDIVCWQAAALAAYYREALLVIESNSLESGGVAAASDASLYMLGELRNHYRNLYVRECVERVDGGSATRPGFHTNRRTKTAAISALIAAVRDGGLIERCAGALDEMLTYEVNATGAYAARPGYHDDMLMTRAIALYVISQLPAAADISPGRYRPKPPLLW